MMGRHLKRILRLDRLRLRGLKTEWALLQAGIDPKWNELSLKAKKNLLKQVESDTAPKQRAKR